MGIVYHGTPFEINEFSMSALVSHSKAEHPQGLWCCTTPEAARKFGKNVYAIKLRPVSGRNNLELTNFRLSQPQLRDWAKANDIATGTITSLGWVLLFDFNVIESFERTDFTDPAVFVERARRLIADNVQFLDYQFEITFNKRGEIYLQGTYSEPDVYARSEVEGATTQYTRKWLLSPKSTDSEVVQTCFKLCITSMEHRTREHFTYKGKRIFGPHFDIEDLVTLCETRENAGGRK